MAPKQRDEHMRAIYEQHMGESAAGKSALVLRQALDKEAARLSEKILSEVFPAFLEHPLCTTALQVFMSNDQQVTRTRTRQQNKPLTRTQSEQRRNDAPGAPPIHTYQMMIIILPLRNTQHPSRVNPYIDPPLRYSILPHLYIRKDPFRSLPSIPRAPPVHLSTAGTLPIHACIPAIHTYQLPLPSGITCSPPLLYLGVNPSG